MKQEYIYQGEISCLLLLVELGVPWSKAIVAIHRNV